MKEAIVNTGLVLDSAETLAELPQAELFLGTAIGTRPKWQDFVPAFRNQGSSWFCTAFAGTSIKSILEKALNGRDIIFSPTELFYRSNGSVNGNTLVGTAEAMKKSVVLNKHLDVKMPNEWGVNTWRKYKELAVVSQDAIEEGKKYKIEDFSVVIPVPSQIKAALAKGPLFLAIGIGKGYWDKVAPRISNYSAYHAVVLLDILEDGTYMIFDSLSYEAGFNGVHFLASNYELQYALVFTDLPENWKEIQEIHQENIFAYALSHYGFGRSLSTEQAAASFIAEALKTHKALAPFFGKEWTVAINAHSYGGYSLQDLLNHYTSIRRGKGPIFDLNRPRK